MKVQVLVIADCPSAAPTMTRLRTALDAVGLGSVPVEAQLIESRDDATHFAFAGSPTILIDGEDLFPGASRTADLACRVYPTASSLAGWPEAEAISAALTASLDGARDSAPNSAEGSVPGAPGGAV